MDDVSAALDRLRYFKPLRADERVTAAGYFSTLSLGAEEKLLLEADSPRLIVVTSGTLEIELQDGDRLRLFAGDSFGEAELIAGAGHDGVASALPHATLALLSRPQLSGLLERLPAVAVPLVTELARELKWHNDVLREIRLARSEGLPTAALQTILRSRSRRLHRHRRAPWRRFAEAAWRAVFTEPARRPTFWIFWGALLAFAGARSVVAYILQNGLQKQLFALIGGSSGNPIHIHHFNYGLLLVTLTGVLTLLPRARAYLRVLAAMFGVGVGLVVDEFALFWNLNPDYYQPSSRLAAGVVLFSLFQIVYFHRAYRALGLRLVALVKP